MNYFNSNDDKNTLNVKEGDKVEIILRSALYCHENEELEYHSGTVSEIVLRNLRMEHIRLVSMSSLIKTLYMKIRKKD